MDRRVLVLDLVVLVQVFLGVAPLAVALGIPHLYDLFVPQRRAFVHIALHVHGGLLVQRVAALFKVLFAVVVQHLAPGVLRRVLHLHVRPVRARGEAHLRRIAGQVVLRRHLHGVAAGRVGRPAERAALRLAGGDLRAVLTDDVLHPLHAGGVCKGKGLALEHRVGGRLQSTQAHLLRGLLRGLGFLSGLLGGFGFLHGHRLPLWGSWLGVSRD